MTQNQKSLLTVTLIALVVAPLFFLTGPVILLSIAFASLLGLFLLGHSQSKKRTDTSHNKYTPPSPEPLISAELNQEMMGLAKSAQELREQRPAFLHRPKG